MCLALGKLWGCHDHREPMKQAGCTMPVGNDTDRVRNPWDVTRPEIRPFSLTRQFSEMQPCSLIIETMLGNAAGFWGSILFAKLVNSRTVRFFEP